MVVIVPRIAYFGPSGTFTEMALAQLESTGVVESGVERIPLASQGAALEAVREGVADAAVVPIESSVEGFITPTLDALAVGSRLQIMAETELPIAFTVVARSSTRLSDVVTIAAYPVAAAQVRGWLAANLPDATVYPSASNAAAAEDVVAGRADAAVSTTLAGERNGLATLADGVADYAGAVTRFVLVTPPGVPPEPTGHDRTSIVFELPNRPGALMRAFGEFSNRGIDLTMIGSRPTRAGMGTYRFHLDCVGHICDDAIAEALGALHRSADVRYLGSWPAGAASADSIGVPPPSHAESSSWLSDLRKGIAR
jgi:prephenate dehydratase